VTTRGSSRRRSRRHGRARRLLRGTWGSVAAVLVAFAVALLLWTRGLAGSAAVEVPPLTGAGVAPVAEGPPTSASATPSAGASGGSGVPTTPGSGAGSLTGFGTLPPDGVHTFTPGPHTVTIVASGQLGTVGYVFKGQNGVTKKYNVSSLRVSRRVTGQTGLAALGVQVSYSGSTASCSIAVDGTVVVHYTASGPYRVVACIA
jgi:hypothetical protein